MCAWAEKKARKYCHKQFMTLTFLYHYSNNNRLHSYTGGLKVNVFFEVAKIDCTSVLSSISNHTSLSFFFFPPLFPLLAESEQTHFKSWTNTEVCVSNLNHCAEHCMPLFFRVGYPHSCDGGHRSCCAEWYPHKRWKTPGNGTQG